MYEKGKSDVIVINDKPASKLVEITPAHAFMFYNDGEIVGTLDFGQEPITFTGDADKSAMIFFNAVIQLYLTERDNAKSN
jgi:hypothetical protein